MEELPFTAVADFDYAAEDQKELSLVKGEAYEVIKIEKEWWYAVNVDGNAGWIPSNYLSKGENAEEKGALENLDFNSVKICYSCDKIIDGQIIKAGDHNYHSNCFVCSLCRKPVSGVPCVLKDGKTFCDACHTNTYSPKCGRCEETISGQYVIALGRSWHPDHFLCEGCGASFKDTFKAHEGRPYCVACYLHRFGLKCDICEVPLSSSYLSTSKLKMHKACFKCEVDGELLAEGDVYIVNDRKIYCEKHRNGGAVKAEIFTVGEKGKSLAGNGNVVSGINSDSEKDSAKKENVSELKSALNDYFAENKDIISGGKLGSSKKLAEKVYISEREKKPIPTAETAVTSEKKIDITKKETYLSDCEFEEVFKMKREQFQNLAAWKQRELKKKVGLF